MDTSSPHGRPAASAPQAESCGQPASSRLLRAGRLSIALALGAASAATLASSPAPAQEPRRPPPAASAAPTGTPVPVVRNGAPAASPSPTPLPPPGAAPAGAVPVAPGYPPPYPYPYPYPGPAGSAMPGVYPYYPYPYSPPVQVPPAATKAEPPPEEIEDEGQKTPAGYHRSTRFQRTPVMLGTSLFAGFYLYSLNVALSSDNTSDRLLMVPIVGPLLDSRDRSTKCNGPCDRQSLLTLDFTLQTAGLALILAGAIGSKPIFVRETKAVSWSLVPAAGPSLRGMLASGEF